MSKTMPKLPLSLLAASCLFSLLWLMKGDPVGFSLGATVNVAISSAGVTVSFFERGHDVSHSHAQIKITPLEEVAPKETNKEEEKTIRSSHRKLISATEHDTVNPQSPLTIPQVNPVPTIVTVPSTNPVSETPLDPTTNPLAVPTATPVTTPPTNPVTTPSLTPPVTNQVPPAITIPMAPPTLVNQAPPSTGIPITPPTTTPIMNPVTPPAATNPPTASGQVWCVAKTGAPVSALQAALDYACGLGGADCSAIQPSGSCYNPNNPQSHASYAFNSYYQKNPVPSSCDFKGAATLVNTNPSSASCIYPSSSSSAAATPSVSSPPATTPNTLSPPAATPITLSPPATTSSSNEPPATTPAAIPPPATTSPNFPPYPLNSSNPDSSTPAIYGSPPPGSSSSISGAGSQQPRFAPILLISLILTGRLCIM